MLTFKEGNMTVISKKHPLKTIWPVQSQGEEGAGIHYNMANNVLVQAKPTVHTATKYEINPISDFSENCWNQLNQLEGSHQQ